MKKIDNTVFHEWEMGETGSYLNMSGNMLKDQREKAHLDLPTRKANAEKPKESVFLPTLNQINKKTN